MSDPQRLSEIQTHYDRAVRASKSSGAINRVNSYAECVNDVPYLLSEVRALTERINKAPHAAFCPQSVSWSKNIPCDCWKAGS